MWNNVESTAAERGERLSDDSAISEATFRHSATSYLLHVALGVRGSHSYLGKQSPHCDPMTLYNLQISSYKLQLDIDG